MSTSDNVVRSTETLGVRECRCSDPENCTEAVPGYRCKAGLTTEPDPDYEPPDPDGECFRGREYASALAEQQAQAKRLK
jgi:hypothetical protein